MHEKQKRKYTGASFRNERYNESTAEQTRGRAVPVGKQDVGLREPAHLGIRSGRPSYVPRFPDPDAWSAVVSVRGQRNRSPKES